MSAEALFPMPVDAPPPGSCVRLERPEPELAVLVFDPPHRSLAVFDGPLMRDLDLALGEIEADASLRGLVLTGRAPGQFIAGADVEAILAVDDPDRVHRAVLAAHALFARIADSRLTTVAAIDGAAPGGACELSLCCDRVVLSDGDKTRIGLPEVRLGIFPAWGGVHRLPRRIGIPAALQAILSGRLYAPRQALRLGLVDRLTKPEQLQRVAADMALGRARSMRRGRTAIRRWLVDRNPLAVAWIGHVARKQVRRETRGHYPAPRRALDQVLKSLRTKPAEFAEREANAVSDLATGSVCKNLVRLFLGAEATKKLGRTTTRPLQRAGVVGAGVMGGAIASLLAERGLWTRLADLSRDALDQALHEHRAAVAKSRKRRHLPSHAATAALDRLDVTGTIEGFAGCDVVVEAVAERLPVKQTVFTALAAQMRDDAILATNTSSLSVDAIAAAVPHPERVCGLHFFNPVRKMPLVEVVRGERTAPEVVTAACALALRLGKTPVVVRDVPGFLVNRCLGPYLDEAIRLFVDGADPARVDKLLVSFGMPMGPFALLDEVGFDIASHAAAALHEAYGARMTPSDGIAGMIENRRLGKKSGHGFYRHDKTGKHRPEISEMNHFHQRSKATRDMNGDVVVDRLVLAMVNEAMRCLDEHVVAGPNELDLALVFGTGFAPFRGGPLRYADSLGLAEVVKRLEAIAKAPDVASRPGGAERFTPTPVLVRRALANGKIHDDRGETRATV